ncbi:hypothetical protein [Bifidobacterium samirii]|uniref:Uncharacterized protein n=1 Tax=Bifidobacterium samirii TaxID=2306974 RepID=A0A430FVA6_9BIFI|nr:hypothetical protein [Bifidobacterium samirii]RSX57722.1 hypothetical protein D2E24_0570 [Bifidobacterium samirii]
MADAPPYRHPHTDVPHPSTYPPDPRTRPPGGRITADGLRRAARILHIIGNILLALAIASAVAVAGCMWFLSRGVYDPADVLVLLAECLLIDACRSTAIGMVLTHAAGFAVSFAAGRRATAAADDVPASGPAPAPDPSGSGR